MPSRVTFLDISLILIILIAIPTLGHTTSGMPDSPKFGFGARVDLNGKQLTPSITAAAGLGLDWIAIDFDWARRWPDGKAPMSIDDLTQTINIIQQNKLNLLLSITNVPSWAITPSGPNPSVVANLAVSLARQYPESLKAIELFPAANTRRGWGATPDPIAYHSLLKITNDALQADGRSVIVIPSITPLVEDQSSTDINDITYLDALYNVSQVTSMPIIGLQLPVVTGEPMSPAQKGEHRVLRHFEEIRQVMLRHNHRSGLIWITEFSWPDGTIDVSDAVYKSPEKQAHWLGQAYQLLKAQLYIGAAFFNQLNPSDLTSSAHNPPSLISMDLKLHPALVRLSQLISPETHKAYTIDLNQEIYQKLNFNRMVYP